MAPLIFQKVRLYLRFKPFDVSTAEGLDRERNRIAILSMFANAGSKGAAMLLVLAGISWTLPYLGEERFGAWMAILSIATVLSFLDFGVGNALTNHVAKALVQGHPQARSALTGGLLVVALISLVICFTLNLAHSYIPWSRLFKTESLSLLQEIEQTVRWFYVLFACFLFSNAVIKAYAGMQRAHIANTVQIVIFAVAIVSLYILSFQEVGIPVLLAVTLSPVCISGLLLMAQLIRQRYFGFSGAVAALKLHAPEVLSVGGLFFVLQIAVIVGWGGDSLIISSTIGLAAVASFALAQRVFQFVSQPFAILNAPFWPAYVDAKTKGNYNYIKQLFRRSILLSGIGGGLGVIVMALISPWVFDFLSNHRIHVNPLFIWLFALWVFLEITGNALSMFLNGVGVVKVQVVLACFFVLIVLPLKFILVDRYGLNGLMGANIIAYVLCFVIPYAVLFKSGRLL